MNDVNAQIARLRWLISANRAEADRLEVELIALLMARGSRPGDGSDQATLFDVAEPTLFSEGYDDEQDRNEPYAGAVGSRL